MRSCSYLTGKGGILGQAAALVQAPAARCSLRGAHAGGCLSEWHGAGGGSGALGRNDVVGVMHVHVHAVGVQLQLHSMWKLSEVPSVPGNVRTFRGLGRLRVNLCGLQRHQQTLPRPCPHHRSINTFTRGAGEQVHLHHMLAHDGCFHCSHGLHVNCSGLVHSHRQTWPCQRVVSCRGPAAAAAQRMQRQLSSPPALQLRR